jgi:hypothetical protein
MTLPESSNGTVVCSACGQAWKSNEALRLLQHQGPVLLFGLTFAGSEGRRPQEQRVSE